MAACAELAGAMLALIRRLEQHALHAWPATVSEPTVDGWVLRATPGLDRGRSNNALTPARVLTADEIDPAVARVQRFADRHGIAAGIQVSPRYLHTPLLAELDRRGWETRWPVLVMTRPATGSSNGAAEKLGLTVEPAASDAWLSAWAACEGRDSAEVEAHARTVFAQLRGRARFVRVDDDAVAIAVPGDGLLGIFCVAVSAARRRTGLGSALMRAVLAREPGAIPYLQVDERNAPAIALYERLGFAEAYRYCHRQEPAAG